MIQREQKRRAARIQGIRAYYAGVRRDECPYVETGSAVEDDGQWYYPDPIWYENWLIGWDRAQAVDAEWRRYE